MVVLSLLCYANISEAGAGHYHFTHRGVVGETWQMDTWVKFRLLVAHVDKDCCDNGLKVCFSVPFGPHSGLTGRDMQPPSL